MVRARSATIWAMANECGAGAAPNPDDQEMRKDISLLLVAVGLVGVAIFLARRGGASRNPKRETERLLDRCQDMLTRIESAAGNYQKRDAAES